MGILMLIQLILNIAGINLVAILNQVSVWWHIGIVVAVVVLMFAIGKPDQSGLTMFAIQPQDAAGGWDNNLGVVHLQYGAAITYPLFLAFFFSLLQANWTYTGYDASAHVAEETVGARMASAWGVFLSVAVSAIVGFVFLLALVTHMPSLSTLFPNPLPTDLSTASQYYFGGGYAVNDILDYALGDIGRLLSAGIGIAMAFCGLSSVAAAGRMLFAFARDDGVPASGWLKKVSHRYRTPANALDRDRRGRLAVHRRRRGRRRRRRDRHRDLDQHDLPVCRLRCRHLPRRDDPRSGSSHRVWSLGRWSKPVAWLSVFWVIVLMILFSWPTSGNIAWPFMLIVAVFLVIYYFAWARNRFQGPRIMGAEAQLTELEREFEQAAEHLGGTTTA